MSLLRASRPNTIAFLISLIAWLHHASAETLVFVSLSKDQAIGVYSLDDENATLTRRHLVKVDGRPSAMCASRDGQHLYVATKTKGSITALRIASDGELTKISESIVGADPSFLSITPDQKSLLSAYYAAGKVAVHAIKKDKSLSSEPRQTLNTDKNAHCIVNDLSGQYAFVPHTRPNAIFQFRFDTALRTLSANSPSILRREPNSGPRHLSFHTSGDYAYGSDEQGSSVTAYRLDQSTGELQNFQTLSSLPADGFDGKNSTSDIEVHPSGKFVYLANRGHDTIASYRIDTESGSLELIGHYDTEAVTRSFNISADGKFLVAAGQKTGKLAVFRVNIDGTLHRASTLDAGDSPWWVQFVETTPRNTTPPTESKLRDETARANRTVLGQGTMSGEATDNSILLQTRLTASKMLNESGDLPGQHGVVAFQWSESSDFRDANQTEFVPAISEKDYIARVRLDKLQPNTRYYYRPIYGPTSKTTRVGQTASFKTLPGMNPGSDSNEPVRFIVGSCMNYIKFMHGKEGNSRNAPLTATAEDKRLGFPAFASMKPRKPDFFVGTGDIVYYDNPYRRSESIEQLRRCWHEQFRFPRMISFFQDVPTYWSKDDHDFRFNDSDNSSDRLPLPNTGIDLFKEQLPICPGPDGDCPTYRTHRVSRDLQIWITEGRDYRSPNNMKDGPNKTMWGTQQLAWIKQTLRDSNAKWKIMISPTPLVGPDMANKSDNHASLSGFRHEADSFFQWLQENSIENFKTVCGDRHWQYHSIHPTGVEEFACGALNDENSRMGIAPGDPNGTDPNSMVKQPYSSREPSGGFLEITAGDQLRIEFLDDTGQSLYRIER